MFKEKSVQPRGISPLSAKLKNKRPTSNVSFNINGGSPRSARSTQLSNYGKRSTAGGKSQQSRRTTLNKSNIQAYKAVQQIVKRNHDTIDHSSISYKTQFYRDMSSLCERLYMMDRLIRHLDKKQIDNFIKQGKEKQLSKSSDAAQALQKTKRMQQLFGMRDKQSMRRLDTVSAKDYFQNLLKQIAITEI